jgi:heme/copper-type cytochrome/quinol oxidase subunit 3
VGKALSSFNARKAVRAGMLASLFLSLIAALFGAKALHVAAGLVFLMFMTIHLTKYGNLIFA